MKHGGHAVLGIEYLLCFLRIHFLSINNRVSLLQKLILKRVDSLIPEIKMCRVKRKVNALLKMIFA